MHDFLLIIRRWMNNEWSRESFDVLPALILFSAVTLSFADFIPIWDGRIYLDCLQRAVHAGWFDGNYSCASHPTAVYFWLLGAFLRIDPDSYAPIIVVNTILAILGIHSFHWLARRLLPGGEHRWTVAAATLAFAAHPSFTANAVQLTPDFGVLVFTLISLRWLVDRKLFLSALFSVAAVFSKESGILLQVLYAIVYAILFVTRVSAPWRQKKGALIALWPLLIPGLIYLASLLVAGSTSQIAAASSTSSFNREPLLQQFLSFSALDRSFKAALFTILALNWTWLATIPVLLVTLAGIGRYVFRMKEGPDDPSSRLITVLFFVTLFALTRFSTFDNVRYYLPIIPLLLLVSMRSLTRLLTPASSAVWFVLLFAGAFLCSNFRVSDPLSKKYFGTFAFGSHPMLRMTSPTGECCGSGRDQLVYNLEFTQFHYMQNELFAALPPAPGVPYAFDSLANWYLVGPLDPGSHRRSVRSTALHEPKFLTSRMVSRNTVLPSKMVYIHYPNFDDAEPEDFLSQYTVKREHRFSHSGYELKASELALKPAAGPNGQ